MKTSIDNSKLELNPHKVGAAFHGELNIDQLRQDYKKRLCVMDMIEKAASLKLYAKVSTYYNVFGNEGQRQIEINRLDRIIARLNNYLVNQLRGEVQGA